MLARCPKLRLLSLWGTGTDNVDLAAATRRGVTVTNTPAVAADSIAEHSLALLLAVARRIPWADREVRQGGWPRAGGVQMRGKTLGIIGLGAIGRRFAGLGAAIGMRVIAWTRRPDPSLGFDLVSLDQIYRESDVVSMHLRLSEESRGIIGPRELGMMKRSAILIRTRRIRYRAAAEGPSAHPAGKCRPDPACGRRDAGGAGSRSADGRGKRVRFRGRQAGARGGVMFFGASTAGPAR